VDRSQNPNLPKVPGKPETRSKPMKKPNIRNRYEVLSYDIPAPDIIESTNQPRKRMSIGQNKQNENMNRDPKDELKIGPSEEPTPMEIIENT